MIISFPTGNIGNLGTGKKEVSLTLVKRVSTSSSGSSTYSYTDRILDTYIFDYNPNSLAYTINGSTRIIPTLQTQTSNQGTSYHSENEFYRLTKAPRDFYIDMRGITSASNPYSMTKLSDYLDGYFHLLEINTDPNINYFLVLSIDILNQHWILEIISYNISLDNTTKTYFVYNFRFRVLGNYEINPSHEGILSKYVDLMNKVNNYINDAFTAVNDALLLANNVVNKAVMPVLNLLSTIRTGTANVVNEVSHLASIPISIVSEFSSLQNDWNGILSTANSIKNEYLNLFGLLNYKQTQISSNITGNINPLADPISDLGDLKQINALLKITNALKSIVAGIRQADYIMKKYIITSNEHTVSEGETLTSIALKYNTTVEKLISINGLEYPYISSKPIPNKNTIYVGKKIKIPNSQSGIPNFSAILPCTDFAWDSKNQSTVYYTRPVNDSTTYLATGIAYNEFVVYADISRLLSIDADNDINGYGLPFSVGDKVTSIKRATIQSLINRDPRISNSSVEYSIKNGVVTLNVDASTWYEIQKQNKGI